MTLNLKRTEFSDDGVFGELSDESGKILFYTLEHSYGGQAKLDTGAHKCLLGAHRLHGMTSDFQTYEITGVLGHAGILFHWGNFNKDSDGCVLLGQSRVGKMVTSSKDAFAAFMALTDEAQSFELIVC